MAFRVAEGFVEVTMDRAKYDASLAKLKGQKLDIAALVKLNDTTARASLAKLAKPLTVKITAQVDDAAAKSRLAALKKPLPVKATVSVADGPAKTALTRLAKAFTITSTVRVVDTAAKAKLAALGKDITIQANVSLNDAAARTSLDRLVRDVTAKLKVIVDDADAKARLKALGAAAKVQIKVELAAASVAAIEAQIKKLTRDRTVKITPVMGDPSTYLTQLSRLTRDQFVQVTPRLKADTYLTQLDRLTRDRHIDVRTNLVAGDTRARLDELTRNRRVRVEVENNGLSGLLGQLARLGPSSGGAAGGVGALSGSVSGLALAAGSAVPTLASLVQAVISMAPAAAVAAPALGSLIAAFGAIKLGTSGIGDAFTQAFKPAVGGAGGAATATHALADAQTALKIAIRDAADANRHAIQQVAAAERDLTTAQRQEKQAQLDLIKARKDAKEQLEDYQNQLVDGELDHRQAVLDVQKAKEDLDKTLANPAATEEQRQEAQLAYDQAVQHLKEQTLAQQRLQQEAADAAKAGVDGNEKVVQSTQDVANAQQDVLDKTQALTEARISADEAAQDGAIRVAQAQQAVADAMQKSGAAAAATADAMAKLAPAARDFVNAVLALKPAWDALKLDVQQQLFTGIGDRLTTVAHQVLPDLQAGLVGTAGILNQVALNALDAVGNLSKTGTLKSAFAGINDGLRPLEQVPARLVTMFGQLTAAAGPAFLKVTQLIADTVGSFGDKLAKSFASGGLTDAINRALDLVGQFGRLLGDVLGTVGNVMKAAASAGGDALGMLGTVFKELRKVTASPEIQGALTALFTTFNTLASVVAPLLGQALMALAPVIEALAPPVQLLIQALGTALRPVIAALGPVLLAAAQAVGQLITAAAPLLTLAGKLAGQLVGALSPILAGLAEIFRQLAPVIQAAADQIGAFLMPLLAQLPALLTPFVNILTTLTGALLPILTQLIRELPLAQLGQAFGQVAAALAPLLQLLARLLADQLRVMMPLLIPIISAVGQLAAIFADNFARALTQIVVPALRMLTQFLNGDYRGAISSARDVLVGFKDLVVREFILIPGQIMGVFDDLGYSLYRAGQSIINSFISGIQSRFYAVERTLLDLTSHLPDWKGPPEVDARILSPSGKLLMDGLMGGISSRVPALRAQLQGITGDIAGMPLGVGVPSLPGIASATGPTRSAAAAPAAASGGITIQNLTISGTFDMSSATERRAAANAMVGEIKDALRNYDRGRSR